MKKKILSTMLALCLVIGLLPTVAFAAGSEPFTDVGTADWFYDEVVYVYDNGLMAGTSDTTFTPDTTTTRGMLVTILYRLDGEPTVYAEGTFSDVVAGAYYAEAVEWAAANSIVGGYGNGLFGPNDPLTREQMAAILYRYAQYADVDVSVGEETNILSYADVADVSEYAIPAMQWACGAGVIGGTSATTLSPKGNATRAQVAVILYRFCEDVLASEDDAEKFTVTFEYNYGSKGTYETVTVEYGETVEKPSNPSRSGYSFSGWYTKASGGSKFDFDTAIDADLTLYARWNSNDGGYTHTHNYTSAVTKEPTCVDDGVMTYTCRCGHSYTEVIPAADNHNCDEKGLCSVCDIYCVKTAAQLNDVLALTDSKIHIVLLNDIEINEEINVNGDDKGITIDGAGHALTCADGHSGGLLNIESASVTVKNLIIDGKTAWEFNENDSYENYPEDFLTYNDNSKIITDSLFKVTGGALTVGEDTVIKNIVINGADEGYNANTALISANNSTVTLDGAEITENGAMIINAVNSDTTLEGATAVTNNFVLGNKGGVFCINGGTVKVEYGVSITGNIGWVRSGLVFGLTNNATMTMNGGVIDGNQVKLAGSNTAGPMICVESGAKFVMNGGSITNNLGHRAGALASRWTTGSYGTDNGIYLNGGTISGNTVRNDDWNSVEIFVRGTLAIGEDMKIDGDVCADSDGNLTNYGIIDGDLYLTTANTVATNYGTITGNVYIKDYDVTFTNTGTVGEVSLVVMVSDNDDLEKALKSSAPNIAVTLASDATLDVSDDSIALGGKNTNSITIDGNGNTLTLQTSYLSRLNTANPDAVLVLTDVTVTGSQESGTWDSYDITFLCATALKDVTFKKSVALNAIGKSVTMEDVSITENHDYFALWIVGGTDVSISGGSITASDGRCIKVSDQYAENEGTTNLCVSGTVFTSKSKAAILVGSANGANITLDDVDISAVEADTTNAVWVDEDYRDYCDAVEVTGGSVVVEN